MDHDPASIGDIVAFVTTADAGGFSAAARRLGRSRSAVAKAVARLEGRLATRLMSRSTRRLALTDDGRRYHDRCAGLLRDLADAEADVSAGGAVPRGTLRLAMPDGYGRAVVLPVVVEYLAAHSQVAVEMSLSDRIGSLVEEGWDVAIRLGRYADLPPELIARVVEQLPHVFVASPNYLDRRPLPTTLDDLAEHDAVVYRSAGGRARWRVLDADGDWTEIRCSARLAVDSAAGMIDAVRLGLGIAYVPRRLVDADVATGRLMTILDSAAGGRLAVTVLYQSRGQLPAKVRAFVDLLAARLEQQRLEDD